MRAFPQIPIHEPTLEYHIGHDFAIEDFAIEDLAIETPVAHRRFARRRARKGSSMTAPRSDAYHDLPPRAVLATVIGVMIAMLMAALDQTIVGTAMPRIISELHGFEHYSAVITAYMVAATAILPIAGKLSDVYGRKPFILGGVVWFMVASALCGFADSMLELVIFRALQGLGAGVMQTMAFTTIADLYPPAKRGRVIGFAASVFGLSSVIGPLIGGFLTDGPGWRYAFYVNLPVGFVALAILHFCFPHIRAPKAANFRIDYAGSLSLVASIVPLLLALSLGWARLFLDFALDPVDGAGRRSVRRVVRVG
jgi:MFS family permease